MSLMPAASFKVTDWLSVGGGPNVMYGYLKTEVALNNASPLVPGDGQLNSRTRTGASAPTRG